MKNIRNFNDDALKAEVQKLRGTDDVEIEFSHATVGDVDFIVGLGYSVVYPRKEDRGNVFNITVRND
jgi:hypothetical protein